MRDRLLARVPSPAVAIPRPVAYRGRQANAPATTARGRLLLYRPPARTMPGSVINYGLRCALHDMDVGLGIIHHSYSLL